MRAVALALLGLAACGGGSARRAPGPPESRCVGRGFDAPKSTGWDHTGSTLTTTVGGPRHVLQDVIAPPDAPVRMRARFLYGVVMKDLEEEMIDVFVDDCAGWVPAGSVRTDDEGVATFTIDLTLRPGAHEVRAVARGDGSQAVGTLWLVPVSTHLVISDVDGTMTTDDKQLFQKIFDGDHLPIAYAGGAALTRAHRDAGQVVVYLTGRPYWLLEHTRRWLRELDFAAGPVHVADSHGDILPTEDSVGAYKRAWLAALLEQGYTVDVAYGNADTDIYAYLRAGLDPTRVYIIGKHGGEQGTHAVTGDWTTTTPLVPSP